VLNKDELDAGHGLFMGVSLSKRRRVSPSRALAPFASPSLQATEDSSSNQGLFSDVVNKKTQSGGPSAAGAKRSFSSVLSRRQSLNSVGGSAITVSSSQFVFLEDSSRTVTGSQIGLLPPLLTAQRLLTALR
jgi:hypothetical protein